jgi:hypothetical protein
MMTAKKFMFPPVYEDADALKLLNEWPKAQHGPLVQIAAPANKAAELQEVSGD